MSAANVVPFAGGKVPAILQNAAADADDLSAGVTGGFAVVSFRGSKWRVKYQGEEHPVLNADGDPIPSLEVVILKANPHITKTYYKQGYSEGAAEQPDCMSMDGLRPDVGVALKQADTCAKCPQNVFGSRITPSGKKAKACQDNRRLAVVPANDIANETLGGPMLLRVPAASLADLSMMGKNLKARGFPYNSVIVKVSFDMDTAYPKLMFKPVRPLTDDEGTQVLPLLTDPKLERILAEAVEVTSRDTEQGTQDAPKADPLFEEPQPTKAKVAKPKVKVVEPPADDLSGDSALEQDIKGILDELGDLS
jgi:hypothetical protein